MGAVKGRVTQIAFMAIVSALLGYAVFMAAQASLGYGFESEIARVSTQQRDLNVLFVKMEKRPKDQVTDEERMSLALRSGELVRRLEALNGEVARARRLALWPAVAVGLGYFLIALRAFLRAYGKRRGAAFFLSPAAVAGAREILEGPFNVEEGHVTLKRQFDASDADSLEVLQLVTQGLFESSREEITLDLVAEEQPFSRFIGVVVSFALDCHDAGKKLTVRVCSEAKRSYELVGVGELANLEVVEPD